MPIQRKKYSTEVGGKTLTLEISNIAGQTNASAITRCGDTVVLTTVVMSEKDSSMSYMPLKVDYEEKFYAAGKILGSRFIRRESRPSEEAVLTGRLIDRTIRPLFDNKIRREMQIVVTVLSIDEENDPEFVGLIGASAALGISDVPCRVPVAGVRVAQIGKEFKINPSNKEASEATFDAFVSGPKGKINMIELGGDDAKEEDIIAAFKIAQKEIDNLIDFQEKIIKEIGKPKAVIALDEASEELRTTVNKFLSGRIEEVVYEQKKTKHTNKLGKLRDELFEHLAEKEKEPNLKAADFLLEEAVDDLVHKNVLEKEKRPDGRRLDEVRELNGEVAILPRRAHGSAIFMRGNTQALGVTTLAPPGAEQLIETMEATEKRRFMLHYNFPPFSVGETGFFRGPGRRDIGHGNLARKAVEALIPPKEKFPYTIRVVSEILSSNGSSSMATVCASVLSMMDAGVPIKKPAAGIAMGLMTGYSNSGQVEKYKILTDIQGPEDHYGDMDLKAAGTEDGVNALQMDVKVDGLALEIIGEALGQARKARLEILKFMKTVISAPRVELSPYVPIIRQIKINPEKIGTVIGPGGKMINGLIAKYELAGIDVEEDGGVSVSGDDLKKVEAVVAEIEAITKEFKVGEIVEGEIIKIMDFGAIMDLGGKRDGMIHVSELKDGFVKTVDEVVKVGDLVRAKIIRADEDGRIGLSIKQL